MYYVCSVTILHMYNVFMLTHNIIKMHIFYGGSLVQGKWHMKNY